MEWVCFKASAQIILLFNQWHARRHLGLVVEVDIIEGLSRLVAATRIVGCLLVAPSETIARNGKIFGSVNAQYYLSLR
jgi:hypothetical protein